MLSYLSVGIKARLLADGDLSWGEEGMNRIRVSDIYIYICVCMCVYVRMTVVAGSREHESKAAYCVVEARRLVAKRDKVMLVS